MHDSDCILGLRGTPGGAEAGGRGPDFVKPAIESSRGGHARYFEDPDGHRWNVVYIPGTLPGPDSRTGPASSIDEHSNPAVDANWRLMTKHRIYSMSVASVYPHYLAKVEKKGRTRSELNEVISWLTGYSEKELEGQLASEASFEDFFSKAPRLNRFRSLITGTICGIRIEQIEEPLMREIRYLDKLVDELAKGRPMAKILRSPPAPETASNARA